MTARPALVSLALALAIAPAPAAAAVWKPGVRAARQYAQSRPGEVTFAVLVGDRAYGHRASLTVPAMSLMKPILMAAYLRRPEVRSRPLARDERQRLAAMIRWSDNAAAERVLAVVGLAGELAVARRAGMRDFVPFSVRGTSETSARDQARLFWRLPRILPRRHRAYAMGLLRTIVREQRWGIARARPRGWRLHFKGGWDASTNHQSALLTMGRRQVALAITTEGGGPGAAETLRGVASRLLRGLARSRR